MKAIRFLTGNHPGYAVTTILGLLFLIWFCIPFFAGIVNIGNVTGVCLSMLLIFCRFVFRLFSWLSGHLFGRIVLGFGSLIVLGILTLAVAGTVCMVKAANDPHTDPSEPTTVIVLGCRVYGESPSTMLRERMDAAFGYLSEHPLAVCILSGGQGADEGISEAECMYRYLTAKGIDPSRLYREDTSTSTQENLENSLALLRENRLPETVVLTTNEYHLYRATLHARSLGCEPHALPAHTALHLFATNYVRELYGIVYEWVHRI